MPDKKRANLKAIFKMLDEYCAKQSCRLFGRLLINIDELRYFRDSGGALAFSRVVVLPDLKKFLTDKEL